jgi:hypothetical protein
MATRIRDVHIIVLFVEPWGAHLMSLGVFYWKNVMGVMEDGFGNMPWDPWLISSWISCQMH